MARHIVMERSAQMPSSCWGRYCRIAVVEVDSTIEPGQEPAMISKRAAGVNRVVSVWDRVHYGTTCRSQRWHILREARSLAYRLDHATPED